MPDEREASALAERIALALRARHEDLTIVQTIDRVLQQEMRPEVLAFARLMEQKLREHDDRPGWKDASPIALLNRLREETRELEDALMWKSCGCRSVGECRHWTPPQDVQDEAADVANFAMMIADVCGGLSQVEVSDV